MNKTAFFWGLLFPLLLLSTVALGQKEAPPKEKELPPFVDWTKARIGGDGLCYYIKEESKDPCLSHPDAFLKKHSKIFNLGEHGKLVLADSAQYRKKRVGYDGKYNYTYFYNGVEVRNAAMRFNMKAGKIGMIATYIPDLTGKEKEFENIISEKKVTNIVSKKFSGHYPNFTIIKKTLHIDKTHKDKTHMYYHDIKILYKDRCGVEYPRTIAIEAISGKVRFNTSDDFY